MDEKKKNTRPGRHGKNGEEQHHGACDGVEKPGKSQSLKDDEMTTQDLVGTSNYERAESDQSKGIFARQTEAYNKALDEIFNNDDENAKDNLSGYMDELKEESESLGHPSIFGQTHPNRNNRRHARH